MVDDELEPVDAEQLDWPVVEPSAGFAERATAAFLDAGQGADERPTTSTRDRRPWIALVAVAAAGLVWLAWPAAIAPSHDAVATDHTQTLAIGSRALAVARAGTVMRWDVDARGQVRIEQDAGRVFYRVDKGGAFEVKTPTGTATVTGTCFEVEIEAMSSRALKAGIMGATLATAVVVTVYEGSVVLANERGDVALVAGDKASAGETSAPHKLAGASEAAPDDVATPSVDPQDAVAQVRRQGRALEAAQAQHLQQETEIERLRQQVRDLGGDVDVGDGPAQVAARAKRCASQGRGGHDQGDCSFLEPDEATLLEMARCATVKIDSPPFLQSVDRPDVASYAGNLGLSDPKDLARLQSAADAHYDAFHHQLRETFVELGGDAAMAEDASASTLLSFIDDQLDGDAKHELQRLIAEERAGIKQPPADLAAVPLEERAFRMSAELGNDFERYVAAEFGDARARELRKMGDGWPGSTSIHSGNCVDPQ